MSHPKTAILDLEELQNLIVLNFPVTVWDVDLNKITQEDPTGIVKGIKGLLVTFKDSESKYLKWFGFDDPTYNATEVLWSLPDEQIGRAEAATASLYMFSTHEQAYRAYSRDKKRRQLEMKRLQRENQLALLRRNREQGHTT
jgi:hypothetical protein